MSSMIELKAMVETDGDAQDLAALFFNSFLNYFWENREKFRFSSDKFPISVLQQLDIAILTLTDSSQHALDTLWPAVRELHGQMTKADFLSHYLKGMKSPTTSATPIGDKCKTLN